MQQVHLAITEIKRFLSRRKKLLILCPILIVALSAAIAWNLPDKYESSITIMVDRDEALNPMIRYNLAVAMVSEDRLKSFNEIIYSRPTINMLIDSLDLATEVKTPSERDVLIEKVRDNINTIQRASDLFSITYQDTEPKRARDAVEILSNHFIQSKLEMKNERNTQMVDFFEEKLDELKETVDKSEAQLMNTIGQDVQNTPRENRSLQRNLEDIETRVSDLNLEIQSLRKSLSLVSSVNRGDRKLSALYGLNTSEYPSGDILREQLSEYESLTSRYTPEFPQVKEMEEKIYETTAKLKSEMEADLFEMNAQKSFLTEQETAITEQIEQTTVEQRQTSKSEVDFDIYRTMYNEMKVKLEQARTTRDLGENARNQFVILDPAIVPNKPSEPKRALITGAGLIVGLFLGIVASAVAEFLDTTIRRPEDLKQFNKPIVAFIPEGNA